MAAINIDPVKSWEQIQWLNKPNDYLRSLIFRATTAFPDLQMLRTAIIDCNWIDANIHLSAVEERLVCNSLLVKLDLMRRSLELAISQILNPNSEQIVTTRLMTYIEMVENSQFLSGKHLKFDISKIASLVGIENYKKQAATLFLQNNILYPSYSAFALQSTILQISSEKVSSARIAADNFCALIGYRINLTPDRFSQEFMKEQQGYKRQYPIVPTDTSYINWSNFYPITRYVFEKCIPGRSIAQIASECSLSGKAVINILKQIKIVANETGAPVPVSNNSAPPSINPMSTTETCIPPPVVVADRDGDAFHSLRVGRKAKLSFHRTLRVPEDGSDYPLPAGLGSLPIHRVEDYADTVPQKWLEEGGFFIPLYQREALFIQFEGEEWCPSIAKVCVGKINAITGQPYSEVLSSHSQDYVVIPQQKWLDGINSGYGTVKQFVAMPLGQGYTIEAQITDEENYGGFQLLVFESADGRFAEPEYSIDRKVEFLRKISASDFELMIQNLSRRQRAVVDRIRESGCTAAGVSLVTGMLKHDVIKFYNDFRNSFLESVALNAKRHFSSDKDFQTILCKTFHVLRNLRLREIDDPEPECPPSIPSEQDSGEIIKSSFRLASSPSQPGSIGHSGESVLYSPPSPNYGYQDVEEMGIAAGGKIKQQIFMDTYGVESWDFNQRRMLKLHMVNSIAYKLITGKNPPPSPITVEEYQESGVPWFSHYDEITPTIKGAGAFHNIIGVGIIDKRRGISDARAFSGIQISPEIIRRVKTPDLNEAVQDFRQRSRENADAGRWEQAIREINYLLDLESGVEAQDYALRSSCNYQIKRYLEGMFDGDMALELDSNCFDAIFSRAYCRLLLGDFLGVKEDAERLLGEPKTELIGLELRAEAALLTGAYSVAIIDALALAEKRPGYHRAEEILSEARTKEHQQLIASHSK